MFSKYTVFFFRFRILGRSLGETWASFSKIVQAWAEPKFGFSNLGSYNFIFYGTLCSVFPNIICSAFSNLGTLEMDFQSLFDTLEILS